MDRKVPFIFKSNFFFLTKRHVLLKRTFFLGWWGVNSKGYYNLVGVCGSELFLEGEVHNCYYRPP